MANSNTSDSKAKQYIEFMERFIDNCRKNKQPHGITWELISANPNVTLAYVDEHPEKPWDWRAISSNPNLTIKYIDDHPEKPWEWSAISYNASILIEDIIDRPHYKWDWNNISSKSTTTFECVEKYKDKPWNMFLVNQNMSFKKGKMGPLHLDPLHLDPLHLHSDTLSSVPLYYTGSPTNINWSAKNINLDYIEEHLDYLNGLIKNQNFINFKKYYECWGQISSNPNLTMEFVLKHIDNPWNTYCLVTNSYK